MRIEQNRIEQNRKEKKRKERKGKEKSGKCFIVPDWGNLNVPAENNRKYK